MNAETSWVFGVVAGAVLGIVVNERMRRSILLSTTGHFTAYLFVGGFTMLAFFRLFEPPPSQLTMLNSFEIIFSSFVVATCPLVIAEWVVRRIDRRRSQIQQSGKVKS